MPRTTRSSRSAWSCPGRTTTCAAAMAIAREEGVPLLPRGGATSQSGQTVGRALVIDFIKHLNRLVEINEIDATCIVEPGIVLDELNRQLSQSGLWFPVDVSTVEPRHASAAWPATTPAARARSATASCATTCIAIDAHPRRRQRGALRRGGAQPRPARASRLPSRVGEGRGGGPQRGVGPPDPSRRGGTVAQGEGTLHRPVPRPARAWAGARRSTSRTPFPRCPRRVGGYLIDALVPGDQAGQPRHAAVRLGGHARRLAPPRAEALAAAEEQGARHLPLRHLPQGHGGGAAHRQAGPRGGRGGRPHADRAGPRHRHVPPGDGDLRARQARRAAAGRSSPKPTRPRTCAASTGSTS